MKKSIGFLLMLGSAVLALGQPNPDATDRDMIGALREALAPLPLNATTVPSGRLLDAGLMLAAPQPYHGSNTAPALGYADWVRLYGTMLTSELATPFSLATPVIAVYPHQPGPANDYVVNLAVLDFDYHALDTAATANGQIVVSGSQLYPGPAWSPSALIPGHLFAAAPLTKEVSRLAVNFRLPEVLWFRQAGQPLPQLIEADFGDEQGWRTVSLGQTVSVTYPGAGNKILRLKASFAGGLVRHSQSALTVNSPQSVSGTDLMPVPIPAVTFVHSGGQISIRLACGHTQLTRPLIVVEGIVPLDNNPISPDNDNGVSFNDFTRDWTWPSIDKPLSQLEAEGYDLCYIEYNNGQDWIGNNANFLKDCLNWINLNKVSGAYGKEPNVIMGVSMGGIVARVALREMELAGQNHDCVKYFSYDSPHNGAYIPIGALEALKHVAKVDVVPLGIVELKDLITDLRDAYEMFNQPAQRQMMMLNIHDGASTDFQNFYTYLNQIGMPAQTQNYVLSNGISVNGTPGQAVNQGYGPATHLLGIKNSSLALLPWWWQITSIQLGFNINYSCDIWALRSYSSNKEKVYDGEIVVLALYTPVIVSLRSEKYENLPPYETVPGGSVDVSETSRESVEDSVRKYLNTIYNGKTLDKKVKKFMENYHVDANFRQFCFIPAISGLATTAPTSNDFFAVTTPSVLLANNRTLANDVKPVLAASGSFSGGSFSNINGNMEHRSYPKENTDWIVATILGPDNLFHDPDHWLINETYNFGQNTGFKTDNRVSTNITLDQNGVLAIGGNLPLTYQAAGHGFPATASTFEVFVGSCDAVTVTVLNGGTLAAGNAALGTAGTWRFLSGSKLVLKAGSTLSVQDLSRVIMEPGAVLEIHPGANITLNGPAAELYLKGTLKMMSGAVLTYSGTGFLHFGLPSQYNPINNITASGPFSVNLVGNSTSDVVAVVDAGTYVYFPKEATSVRFHNSRVELGGGAWIDVNKARVEFTNTDFVNPAGSSTNRYKAVYINGPSFATTGPAKSAIDGCTFRWGTYGLYARNLTTIAKAPEITNCTFTDCYYGLMVNGKSATVGNCTFDRNVFGTYFNQASGISRLNNTHIRGTVAQGTGTPYFRGIYFVGSGGSIYMQNVEIRKYPTASYFYSSGNQHVVCGQIKENATCFHVRGGSLRMGYGLGSTTNGIAPGHVDALSNKTTLLFQHAQMPVLNQGNNDLRVNNFAGALIATGSIDFPGQILVSQNWWKNSSTGPVAGTDYVLDNYTAPNGTTYAVTLSDPSPMSYLSPCPTEGPASGSNRPWQGLGITINTESFNNVPLDVAMDQAADLLYGPNQEIESPLAAAALFHEILMANYSANQFAQTPMLQLSLDLSLAALREALAEGIERDLIPSDPESYEDGMLSGIPALYSEAALSLANRYAAIDTRSSERVFQTRAERALMFSMIGWENKAAVELAQLYPIASSNADEISFLNHWICQMQQLHNLRSGAIDVYAYEAAAGECPALSDNAPAARPAAPATAAITPETEALRIYPNPAQEAVQLAWTTDAAAVISLCGRWPQSTGNEYRRC